MADSKKYYWLKLKRDFFKRHDIRIIESMPNGKDYVLFYLKLLLESVDHEGNLRFSDTVPYSPEMLSVITNTNVDIVRSALKVFSELNMVEILDDSTIFMSEVQRLTGCAADNDGANRVRRFREKQKSLALPERYTSVTKCNESKSIEKEIDIELEKEIEIEIDLEGEGEQRQSRTAPPYQEIVDIYNSVCTSFPKLRAISDARKRAIGARLKTYTLEDFKTLFEKAEASRFLKGANDRNWSATFDWLITDSNMAKVLDGNYDDNKTPAKRQTPQTQAYVRPTPTHEAVEANSRALERTLARIQSAREG